MSAQFKELIAEKESVKSDRLKLSTVERETSLLNNDISKKKECLFFDENAERKAEINAGINAEKIS